jgi:hypothetical protein
MSEKYKPVRCKHPDCIGFGSLKLGGYCKNHADRKGHIIRNGYYGYGYHDGEFIPKEYGLVKDKYGYEEV